MTFLQSSSESSRWSQANLRHCWRCLLVFRGTFLGCHPWRPLHLNALVMVNNEMPCPGSPRESLRSCRVTIGVTVAAHDNLTSDLWDSFCGQPVLQGLVIFPMALHLLMTLCTVERGTLKEWDIWQMDLLSPCCLMMVSLMSVDSSFPSSIVLAVLLQMTVACGQQCLAVPAVPFHDHTVLFQFPLHLIQGYKHQQHAVSSDFCRGGGKWLSLAAGGGVGGKAARGLRCGEGGAPSHGRKKLKFHFKKATKLVRFLSLR